MYKFSAPMPYTIEDINKLLDINSQVQKSKITSLYACVPRGCEVFTGFEQSRNFAFDNVKWDYWKNLIEHTLNKEIDFIYLLNSPRPLNITNLDFPKQLETLDLLLTELRKLGVNKLRIASGQLMSYISKHYSDFDVLASTSLEYKTICEYQNFIHQHPYCKQIVPSHDINKNFKLLKNLRKRYPNVEIELMVNEGCLQGCPNRMFHEYINVDSQIIINGDICLSGTYATSFCSNLAYKYPIHCLIIGTHIFPWDIIEYSKIGITNFKLVGRDAYLNDFMLYLNEFVIYLKCIENIKFVSENSIVNCIHHLNRYEILKRLSIEKYKKYLPKISHFVKKGHLCSSICGMECRYCYNCADKIQKVFKNEQQNHKKQLISFCSIEN